MPYSFADISTRKALVACLALVPALGFAEGFFANAVSTVTQGIQSEWDRSMSGTNDLYVPAVTWHNRATYDHDKIDSFNEHPWGLGFGKSYLHDNGDWSGFYAMAFKDSHNDWEPIAGYGYTKNFHPMNNPWFVGIGYTVFLTSRSDYSYIPILGALPLASMGYKNFTIQGTYIPGKRNNGNVAFLWGKYAF